MSRKGGKPDRPIMPSVAEVLARLEEIGRPAREIAAELERWGERLVRRAFNRDRRRAAWKRRHSVEKLVRGYRRYHAALIRMQAADRWNFRHARTGIYLRGQPRELAFDLLAAKYDIPPSSLRKLLRGKLRDRR